MLNLELKELVRAGATHLQIDEPYYSGFPEDLPWALKAINAMVDGVNAHVTLHICYGNRYGKPSFEGSYQFLFPAILEAKVQAVSMEFARRGEDDLELFKKFNVPFQVGIGVIDVKTNEVESPAFVADRIRRALDVIPAERLDHHARLRTRAPASRCRVQQAECDGRRALGRCERSWVSKCDRSPNA